MAGAGGPVTVRMDAFKDDDGDGLYDVLDKCPTVPGIEASGGCPPSLRGRVSPSVSYAAQGNGGVRITRLTVDSVPKGAKVSASCTGCGSQTVTAKRQGRVTLNRLVGRIARAGGSVEVKITMRRTAPGATASARPASPSAWPWLRTGSASACCAA